MAQVDVVGKITGGVDNGGWEASGLVFNDADRLEFYQQLEIWFDLYAGGSWATYPRAGFVGYLMPDPWRRNVQGSELPWSAYTAQEFMKRGRVQGIFFKDVGSPTNWHQIDGMTYAGIVDHIVGIAGQSGHSNLVRGVWPEGIITLNTDNTNSSAVDEYEVKEGNFWQRLQEIANIDFYVLYMDKAGVLNYVPHPMFGGSLPDPVLTLTSDLLLEPLQFERRNDEEIGQVKLFGTTPAGAQISGKYPTNAEPGPIVSKGGYMASSNSKMAAIAERMFKFENRDYTVTAKIGNGLGLLLELMDRVAITYTSSQDGISWSSKKFWVHKISVSLKDNFTAETELVLEAENA